MFGGKEIYLYALDDCFINAQQTLDYHDMSVIIYSLLAISLYCFTIPKSYTGMTAFPLWQDISEACGHNIGFSVLIVLS